MFYDTVTNVFLLCAASSESVASVTGVGGHSTHWSQTSSPHIVVDHSIGRINLVRAGGGWSSSRSCIYT